MSNVAHPRHSPKFPVPLRLHDPIHIACWVEDLTNQVNDLLSAARDATERKRHRVLSRAAARGKIEDAAQAVEQLLLAVRRGLADFNPPAPAPVTSHVPTESSSG